VVELSSVADGRRLSLTVYSRPTCYACDVGELFDGSRYGGFAEQSVSEEQRWGTPCGQHGVKVEGVQRESAVRGLLADVQLVGSFREPGDEVKPERGTPDRGLRHVVCKRLNHCVPAGLVAATGAAHVPVDRAAVEQSGVRGLGEDAGRCVRYIVLGCHLAGQVARNHQPGQLDGGRERGVGRPDEYDSVGDGALERGDRLAVVAVLRV
jgi:hypothetical protein